nr:immunoglobulin light chain junction region [Macaca mulatta]MOW71795.1 immunoglobulin light chain junction region [Macaca mulatta]
DYYCLSFDNSLSAGLF